MKECITYEITMAFFQSACTAPITINKAYDLLQSLLGSCLSLFHSIYFRKSDYIYGVTFLTQGSCVPIFTIKTIPILHLTSVVYTAI